VTCAAGVRGMGWQITAAMSLIEMRGGWSAHTSTESNCAGENRHTTHGGRVERMVVACAGPGRKAGGLGYVLPICSLCILVRTIIDEDHDRWS
jgi:hypothetical protein